MNKIIILDNFFEDPNSLRNLALTLSYRSRNSNEYFEGIRSQPLHEIDEKLHSNICSKIIQVYFGNINLKYNASLFFHQTREQDLTDSQWLNDKIHQDAALLAGIVFLSPNAPISCGTQTYKKINKEYFSDVVMGNEYNRLILYPANCYHSACGFFGKENNNRLTLLFFLNSFTPVLQ